MKGKKDLLAAVLRYSGANRALRAAGAWRGLIVLNFHRIGDPATTEFDAGVFSATQMQFAAQLRALARHCDVIGLKDLDRALLDRRGRYALITFDDGYRDNYELAFPVLREARLPAVFFLTTGFLDDGLIAWWDEIAWMVRRSPLTSLAADRWLDAPLEFAAPDRERAVQKLLQVYKRLPGDRTASFLQELSVATGSGRCPPDTVRTLWMTWDMVREMRAAGMDIGGHTVTHPILARLPEDQQLWEVTASQRRIEAELGEPIEAFSYPVGAPDCFNAGTRRSLERAGCRWGFSFYGGYHSAGRYDPFDLPRYPIDPVVTPNRLAALLTWPQLFAQP